jgi:uroporphyrinogen decarboxylase
MTKLERVKASLAGLVVDRPPYSFWTHMPGIDLDPERLAVATAEFAVRHDVDFIKSMPNGLYCVEDWGAIADYAEVERGGVARVVAPVVSRAADWPLLPRLDVRRGAFGRELDHLARLTARMQSGAPVLATVFSPLTIAGKLSNGLHRSHSFQDPLALMAGLDTIATVMCDFAREAIVSGCAGVFLAVQDATLAAFSEDAYRRFGEALDRKVLAAAQSAGAWFNVVHMHGDRLLFDLIARYDVAALNWHIGETAPSVAEYRASNRTSAILGGIQRAHVTEGDIDGIRSDIERTLHESGARGLLLSPGCVIRHPVDPRVLDAAAALITGPTSRG